MQDPGVLKAGVYRRAKCNVWIYILPAFMPSTFRTCWQCCVATSCIRASDVGSLLYGIPLTPAPKPLSKIKSNKWILNPYPKVRITQKSGISKTLASSIDINTLGQALNLLFTTPSPLTRSRFWRSLKIEETSARGDAHFLSSKPLTYKGLLLTELDLML